MKTQKKTTPRTVRYGYKLDSRTGAVTEDPKAQETIDYIVRQRWAGFSFAGIAEDLTAEGIPAARGGSWSGQAVSNVYDNVTLGRVGRLEKEDAAAQAQKDAEAEDARAEHARLTSPEHQFKTRGYYVEQVSDVDTVTGEVEGTNVKWDDKAKFDNHRQREDAMTAARLAKGEAMNNAYLALTDKERADLYIFDLPWRTRPGQSRERVDEVVEKVTAPLREEADRWCDAIEGQATVKKNMRMAINTLLGELAIQRQATLHYHGELEREQVAHQVTKEAAKAARNAAKVG